MINANQLFKAGRETKIFEVSDRLQVNDFYNESGYRMSSIHGKFSRIKFTIVDITKGSKDKAIIGEFNFKPTEWELLQSKLKLNGIEFNEKLKKINMTKANPYNKIGDKIEVKTIVISYETGLRVPRWKIVITTGKAAPKEEFGYDKKTYTKLSETNFMLDDLEMKEMVLYVSKFLKLWEENNFSTFIKNREAFINRAKKNNYDEESLDKWNAKNSTTDSFSSSSGTNKQYATGNQKGCCCSNCGKVVEKSKADITLKSFGKVLCSECLQKKFRNK
ncbi:hypothetical protein [Clostridium thermobutyricum]|uniref:hypothetical protein n=1 Tax=Clostridium thermobutyricum TaxID=29372 RepID=UPI0018AB9357|nr:hypothetical protein [Clostridium thermobutyricum]